jgi:HEAT repeat protein
VKDQDAQLRGQACAALGEIADRDAVEYLIEALNDKETKHQAWKVLNQITKMNFGFRVEEWKKWHEREKGKTKLQ